MSYEQTLDRGLPAEVKGIEVPYRSFFTVTNKTPWLNTVIGQIGDWLREPPRLLDIDLSSNGYLSTVGRDVTVIRTALGKGESFLLRMREQTDSGTWRTHVTLHAPSKGEGWVLIEVSSDEGKQPAPPRLAGRILDVVDAFDGGAELTTDAVPIHLQRAKEVLHELCDPARTRLMFVAGTGSDQTRRELFMRQVERLNREIVGLSRFVVLDPLATKDLQERLGDLAVPEWGIRTYLPDVDPARRYEARSHRLIAPDTLLNADHRDLTRLARTLGRSARRHAAGTTLPAEVARTVKSLARLETRSALDSLRQHILETVQPETTVTVEAPIEIPSPSVADEASIFLAQIEMVKRILDLDTLDEESLRKLAESARLGGDAFIMQVQEELDRLDERNRELEKMLADRDNELLEYARDLARSERRASMLARRNRWLQHRLELFGDYEGAYGDDPDAPVDPSDLYELIDRWPSFEPMGVIISADHDKAIELDEIDDNGYLTDQIWKALLFLAGYVRARQEGKWDQGIDRYVENPPNGYPTWDPGKFAATETATTMARWGSERVFPVPTSVDSSGVTAMRAHLRLARIGAVSPRLYFLDRYSIDGKVYVGYVGEHPTNTMS